jgi:hypothetical protein
MLYLNNILLLKNNKINIIIIKLINMLLILILELFKLYSKINFYSPKENLMHGQILLKLETKSIKNLMGKVKNKHNYNNINKDYILQIF